MKKMKLNLVIDALLLLCLAAIAGIGLLIKYVQIVFCFSLCSGVNLASFFSALPVCNQSAK